jgi:signal peptidase I
VAEIPDEPDEGARSSADKPTATAADAHDLSERLADVHRRTADLAERVASFQAATTELADSLGAEPNGVDEPGGESRDRETTEKPANRRPAPVPRRDHDPADAADEDSSQPKSPTTAEAEQAGAAAAVAAGSDGSNGAHATGTDAPRRPRPGPAPAADQPGDPDAAQAAEKPTEKAAERPAADKSEKTAEAKAPKPPKKKRTGKGMPKWLRRVRSLVIVAVIVVAAAWALRTYVASPYYVPSASMEPTLHGCPSCNNDHVLVQKLSYDFHDPERSDIVVFENPGGKWAKAPDKDLIKRVIGVPGDHISIRNRHVFINGAKENEPYVNKACHGTAPLGLKNGYRVPKGDIFVMGDNRCNSEDSRMFGPVPIDKVVGKALIIFWPISRFGSP